MAALKSITTKILLAIAFTTPLCAQNALIERPAAPPDAPQPQSTPAVFHRALYIAEVSTLASAVMIDGALTVRNTKWGYSEAQSPWLYGRYPTWNSYLWPALASTGAACFAAWKLEHSGHRWMRATGHSIVWFNTASHLVGIAHDYTLAAPNPPAIRIAPPHYPVRK